MDRQRIVDVALEIAHEQGVKGVTMTSVAERLGVAMMPRFFANDVATRRSISLTFLPMRNPLGPARSTATTASISSSSCTLPEYSIRFMAYS